MNRIIIFEGCDRTGKSTCIQMLATNLKEKGFNVFVFHLMGPNKFQNHNFNNDEKSLIQLSKFDDQLYIFEEMLNADPKTIIILDRSHFGEFVWTKYWNRTGKYTDTLFSDAFNEKHKNIFKEMLYINYFISNIKTLAERIKSSQEDLKIFSENNKSVEENIDYVYTNFNLLEHFFVKPLNINYIKYDNIGTLNDVENFVNYLISQFILQIN